MSATPERVAAAARAVEGSFLERLAIHADALAAGLCATDQLVAWDREQLIGAMQSRVRRIAGQRLSLARDPAVRVLERRGQPLECIDLVWRQLRRGQRVFVEYESGTCPVVLDLLRGIIPALAPGSLRIADAPGVSDDEGLGPRVGVEAPGPRVALIDADADRELAAYVLARTSLRRSGCDPRAVKAAYVCGSTDLLQRHVRRLWVGVNIGPATDSGSFAGPIDAGVREAFLDACQQWTAEERVQVWCEGAALERTGSGECYAAPALFYAEGSAPQLPMAGPMLVIVGCEPAQAKAGYEAALAARGQAIQVGGRVGQHPGITRHIRGALLVERLPPGLPEPRPV
ncbi:MAG: hypothetical protein AAF721_17780 [Myxococcota bacterium]